MNGEPAIRALFEQLQDTMDVVEPLHARTPAPEWLLDELSAAWRDAQDEAAAAYDHWRATPGAEAYAVYRASQDRADAAQATLHEAVRR